MNAVTPFPAETGIAAAARLKLRVLGGRNAGAEHGLPPDRKVVIGHSYENDIVLRNAQSRGYALHLTPFGKLASLEVVAGEIVVLGRKLVAGEKVMLEPYVPVRMCGFVFAIGGADEDRWEQARQLAEVDPLAIMAVSEAPPHTNLPERIELRTQDLRNRIGDTLLSPRVLALAAAALLALAVGTLVGTNVLGPADPSPTDIRRELSELSFDHLSVERGVAGGGLAVVGLVADESELLRLRDWAERTHPDIALGVMTLGSAAEAADNLLAAHNVDAKVSPSGRDGLLIEAEFLPPDRKAELQTLLKRDLPRVRRFIFSASGARGQSELAYFFNAPGYGAASFVAGDPGYIVTEDGTRWFAGATLPTGHTILEVTESSVTVERGGMRETLTMSTPPTTTAPSTTAKETVP